jgi:hypothetical protein
LWDSTEQLVRVWRSGRIQSGIATRRKDQDRGLVFWRAALRLLDARFDTARVVAFRLGVARDEAGFADARPTGARVAEPRLGAARFGVARFGVARFGVARFGVARFEVAWFDVARVLRRAPFLPPPSWAFTVAQARAAARSGESPRAR